MSLEEKREKLLQMFYEKKEPLNLKEVEKFGAKRGIVLQSVKDVNQSLVDDNLVETDRIGIGCFWWALPSKGFQVRKNLIEDYDKKLETCKTEIEETTTKIKTETEKRDSMDGKRDEMIAELAEMQKKRDELNTKLK